MQAMESQFDVCTEDLFNQTIKLEEMEKKAGNAEGEVSALRGRLILLQENNEKQEERLAKATLELAGACQRADASVRKRIELENGVSSNEETIDNLDKQLAESKGTLSDSENKFDSFPHAGVRPLTSAGQLQGGLGQPLLLLLVVLLQKDQATSERGNFALSVASLLLHLLQLDGLVEQVL